MPLLPPATFAIIMSTGTLACATLAQAETFAVLKLPAQILCWLNLALFVFLAPYAAINWLWHRTDLRSQCHLPGQQAFFSTIGIALLVLSNQSIFFDLGEIYALTFWLAGVTVTFLLNFAILFKVFVERHEQTEITPVFFIPAVGLVVIPLTGCALATDMGSPWNSLFLIVCLIAMGAGLMLYSGLFATMMQRHLLLEPVSDHLTPTLWIHLAPIGWGAIGMLSLGKLLTTGASFDTLEFLALLAWGAAAWWVIMATILTIRALAHHGLYFSMAWWSFIFPLGSFALLTKMLNIPCSQPISFTVWLAMLLIWLADAYKTLRMALKILRHGHA